MWIRGPLNGGALLAGSALECHWSTVVLPLIGDQGKGGQGKICSHWKKLVWEWFQHCAGSFNLTANALLWSSLQFGWLQHFRLGALFFLQNFGKMLFEFRKGPLANWTIDFCGGLFDCLFYFRWRTSMKINFSCLISLPPHCKEHMNSWSLGDYVYFFPLIWTWYCRKKTKKTQPNTFFF